MDVYESEVADARHLLQRHRFVADRFEFDCVRDEPDDASPIHIYPIRYTVTVLGKGCEPRSYRGGHGTAWLVEFERDLKSGRFEDAR